MSVHHFVWTDLSTFDMPRARADYGALFGWSFTGDDGYDFATQGEDPVAAITPMPPKMVALDMPSFWMSYIRVEDVAASVKKARLHDGVVVEVEPQASDSDTKVALVRDPSGAGFTLYEGPDILPPLPGEGVVLERTHHLASVDTVALFYTDLFGWRFTKLADSPWPTYAIHDADGAFVAYAEEVPKEVRGKFSYWMPCFSTTDMAGLLQRLEAQGGEVLTTFDDGRVMARDGQGAHFLLRETAVADPAEDAIDGPETAPADKDRAQDAPPASRESAGPGSNIATWRTGIGLACIWAAVALDLNAFWGVLFLIWTWPALRSGVAYFIDPVGRRESPTLFWALVGTWVLLSLWLIGGDIWPLLGQG